MKRVSVWLMVAAMLSVSLSASATMTVTDDFNWSADGELAGVGTGWTQQTGNPFYVFSSIGRAVNNTAGGTDSMASMTGVDTLDQPFSAQVTAFATHASEFVGVAFGVQDGSNYYFVRVMQDNSWTQVVKVADGSYSAVYVNTASGWSSGGAISVSGDGAGNFSVLLGGSTFSFNDPTPFVGGSVGLYYVNGAGGGTMAWDDFSVTYVPEPVTLALLAMGGVLLRKRM